MPKMKTIRPIDAPAPAASTANLIDLARYPIEDRKGAAYRSLLARVQDDLAASGACVLEQFLQPATVRRILEQIDPLAAGAYVCGSPHNVFLAKSDPYLPPDHPRNRLVESRKACLAHDEIPAASPLHAIYGAPSLRGFIADALGFEALYPYEDPLASININFYGAGQELGWHFDNAPFVVTLMLRQAESGGVFEFAPNIRDESESGFRTVGRILAGNRKSVRELAQGPGALVFFRGSRSMHRVTPSFGRQPRTIAILSYAPEPGQMLAENVRQIFYGRAG
jgi:alkylated DNA repair dioxygenase AlkB